MEAGPRLWHRTTRELLAGGSGRQLGGGCVCGGPSPAARLAAALQTMCGLAAATSRLWRLAWLGWRCLRPNTARVQVGHKGGRVPLCT